MPAFIGVVIAGLIIGAGGNVFSWFNDSGVWIVKEIGGRTQTGTFRSGPR